MSKQYWLMKSEPDVFGWDDLVKDGSGIWDGVRNHSAKLNMKAMKSGDEVIFYHSNIGREAVGIMTITDEAYPDPTADEGSPWVVVGVKPVRKLKRPISLAEFKADPRFADMDLIKYMRLSVGKIKPDEWQAIMELAGE